MAGEQGRKLRSRVASSSSSSMVPRQETEEASKKARLASKRPANNENNVSGFPQPARKRVALSNLTNNASSRNALQDCKNNLAVQGKTKNQTVSIQQKQVELKHEKIVDVSSTQTEVIQEGLDNKSQKIDVANALSTEETMTEMCSDDLNSEVSSVCNMTKILDAMVLQNYRAFMDPMLAVRQEREGWSSQNYTDIDDNKDPQMCSTYAADIYFHLRTAELKRRPTSNFMETMQKEINESMRSILVDWLIEVAEEYKLVPETLYLAVTFIDRFLSENLMTRQRLQLLGVSCMLIASKYEEICPPQVDDFCYITDNTYSRAEILEMEKSILSQLKFELAGPTTKTFLCRIIRAAQAGQKKSALQLECLGNYLAELTLVEYGLLRYLPSMIASSAVFLAKLTLDPTARPWNATLEHYSGYKSSDLKDCVKAIHDLQCNKKHCTLPAVREKYKQFRFEAVAELPPPASIPLKYFDDVYDTQG